MEDDEAQKQREHKKRQRQRRKEEHLDICANVVARCEDLISSFAPTPLPTGVFSWDGMPPSLSPLHNLTGSRAEKKKQQCESFARALASIVPLAKKRLVIIDFGSGSGNASLPLAWWFRDVAVKAKKCFVCCVNKWR